MSAADIEALLPAFIADELPAEERARVEAAVAASPQLQTELARYRYLFTLLSLVALEGAEPPAGLETRIVRQIAIQWYLNTAVTLLEGLLRSYGRAIRYYLSLS